MIPKNRCPELWEGHQCELRDGHLSKHKIILKSKDDKILYGYFFTGGRL
jgi:hypothetical protein